MVLDCMDSLSLLSSFLCKTFYQISMCEVLNFFGDCCIGIDKYRSTSLCQTCLSQIHGLCRSDHPFPNFSPILHCNSTLLMSNSVIMKTRLFRSDFSFPKVNFPFVYHCLYLSGQKVKRSE